MTLEEILAGAQAIGVIGVLISALVGGFRRWWVWGWADDQGSSRIR